jgi:hypothetical protein
MNQCEEAQHRVRADALPQPVIYLRNVNLEF